MRNLFISLTMFLYFYLIFSPNLRCLCSKVDYQILNIDLFGICNNSEVIILYGEYGNILISNDWGKNWEQKTIKSLSNYINKIIAFDDKFWGLLDSTVIIKSDNGKRWEEIQLPINNKTVDVSIDSSFIYLLSSERKEIFILTHNYYPFDSIELENEITEFVPVKGYLIIGTNVGKLYIYDTEKRAMANLFDLSSTGNNIHNFNVDGGKIFFLVNNSLYSLYEPFSPPEFIANTPSSNYTVKDGEIYMLNVLITLVYNKMISNWVGFYKYDKMTREFVKVNNDNLNRFIDSSMFNIFLRAGKLNFKFVNDNVIIVVSNNKTILISGDKGVTWELVSFLDWPLYNFAVMNNYIWGTKQRSIFRSKDYGVTWLPQKADSIFVRSLAAIDYPTFLFFDSSGKGFAVNTLRFYYPETMKNFEILYSSDFGENYRSGSNKYLKPLNSVYKEFIDIIKYQDKFVLKKFNVNNLFNPGKPLTSVNIFLDSNFSENSAISALLYFDTIISKIFLLSDDKLYGYFWKGIYSDTSYYFRKDISSWISYSNDGVNWVKLFDTEVNEYPKLISVTTKGPIVLSMRGYTAETEIKMYLIDVFLNKTILLLQRNFPKNSDRYPLRFLLLQDNIIYSDPLDSIIYSCDLSSPSFPRWERLSIFDPLLNYFGYNIRFSDLYLLSDSVFCFSLKTSNKDYLIKAIVKDSIITNVEKDNFALNKLFVQTLPPFPQPASSFVKAKVYIEGFREIEKEYFKIYDLSGNTLTNAIKTSVDKLSPFLFEATLDVSGLPNGIYFVRYAKMEESFSFPIIIYR
ncbi:MAG: hypothetical protein ACK42Z_03955 [Candidatus Kapaibacteriota bacterium]